VHENKDRALPSEISKTFLRVIDEGVVVEHFNVLQFLDDSQITTFLQKERKVDPVSDRNSITTF